jgi:hypothetical protein
MSAWMEEREGVERALSRAILVIAVGLALGLVVVMLRVRRLEEGGRVDAEKPKRTYAKRVRIVKDESE